MWPPSSPACANSKMWNPTLPPAPKAHSPQPFTLSSAPTAGTARQRNGASRRDRFLLLSFKPRQAPGYSKSGGLFEGAFDKGEAALGLFGKKCFAVAAVLLGAVKF